MPVEPPANLGPDVPGHVAHGELGRHLIEVVGVDAGEHLSEEGFLRLVGDGSPGERGVRQSWGEPGGGPQDRLAPGHCGQEVEHAAPVGEGAVEVEGGDISHRRPPLLFPGATRSNRCARRRW